MARAARRRSCRSPALAATRASTPGDRVAGYLPNLPESDRRRRSARRPSAPCGRRARRTSASRASWIDSARSSRRCSWPLTATPTPARRTTASCASPRLPRGLPSVRRVVVVPHVDAQPAIASLDRARLVERVPGFRIRARRAVRAIPVRSSALHPVLLGHDRRAEVHRARRRRHADSAPEGAPAALRHPGRRPRVLLHHLRLDDVELAGVRARLRSDAASPGWIADAPGRPRAVRSCGRDQADALRHVRQVHRRHRKDRRASQLPLTAWIRFAR